MDISASRSERKVRYSKLNVSPGSQKFSFIKTKLSDRASAIANPYWTLKQPSKRRDVSFADSLAALVAKARKQQEAGDGTDAALLDDIEDVMHSHGIHLVKQRAPR